jgi:hypothetical protein
MKKFILSFVLFVVTCGANADMMRPAFLGLVCSSTESTKIVKIVSESKGSSLVIDDIVIDESANQLIAGTEGGDPYLQYVQGGYNVTISGGDFQTAFYDPSQKYLNGETNASVWYQGKTYNASCKGVIAF